MVSLKKQVFRDLTELKLVNIWIAEIARAMLRGLGLQVSGG